MREEDEIHVNNIISCISEIEGYIEGMSYEEFSTEEEVRQSVASNLQEIGEAASLLSDDFVSQFTEVDYRVLELLKRAKFDESLEVDYHALWGVINSDLPSFRNMLATASEQMRFDEDAEGFSGDFHGDDDFGSGRGKYRKSGRFEDEDDFDDDFAFDDEDDNFDLDDEDDRF